VLAARFGVGLLLFHPDAEASFRALVRTKA
jgi:hypothetical protein